MTAAKSRNTATGFRELRHSADGRGHHGEIEDEGYPGARVRWSRVGIAIDSTFPLAEAREAHKRAARGHLQGKIVLEVE